MVGVQWGHMVVHLGALVTWGDHHQWGDPLDHPLQDLWEDFPLEGHMAVLRDHLVDFLDPL